jgi:xylulokinase
MSVCFIGVDLGTSGIKAGLMNESGKIIARTYWNTTLTASQPGQMEQDPDFFYKKTVQIIKETTEKSGVDANNIAGITIAGQMGGIIGVDKDFNSVTGLDMGLDIRSEKYNTEIHKKHGKQITTTTFGSPRNTPKIMMWAREHRKTYSKVEKFVTLSGYVSAKLAGLKSDDAFIDYTLLTFFGNEDAEKLCWSEELTATFGLDIKKFPRVVNPWDIIGNLTAEPAKLAGLKQGTPIIAGAGDQPAGFLGAGFVEPNKLLDVSGSTTLLFANVNSFSPDTKNHTVMFMPSVIKGSYTAFTYINGGGITLKWFCDEFAPGSSLDSLVNGAKKIPPGSGGLLFIPYFGGRQCPYNAEVRGAWIGLNWGHKKEYLFRAILEGLTFDYTLSLEHIRNSFPEIDTSSITGIGGGTKSNFWNRIKADVLNIPYLIPEENQFTLRGCGIITGYAVGVYNDLQTTAKQFSLHDKKQTIQPDKKNTALYKPFYSAFKKALQSPLIETMQKISTIKQQ